MFLTTKEISSNHRFADSLLLSSLGLQNHWRSWSQHLPYGTTLHILPHPGKQLLNPMLCYSVLCCAILPHPFYHLTNFQCLKEALHDLFSLVVFGEPLKAPNTLVLLLPVHTCVYNQELQQLSEEGLLFTEDMLTLSQKVLFTATLKILFFYYRFRLIVPVIPTILAECFITGR